MTLEKSEWRDFEHLALPIYRKVLREPKTASTRLRAMLPSELVCVGMTIHGRAAGLVIVEVPSSSQKFDFLSETPLGSLSSAVLGSVAVTPEFRRQGLATEMVRVACDRLGELGFSDVRAQYSGALPSASHIRKLLVSVGFSEPELRRLDAHVATDMRAKLRLCSLPIDHSLKVAPWSELDDAIGKRRKTDKQQHSIPPGLAPWTYPPTMRWHPASVGLIGKGELLGWMLVRDLGKARVAIDCGYIEPRGGGLGIGLRLFGHILDSLNAEGVGECWFSSDHRYPGMLRLMQIALPATALERVFVATKTSNGNSRPGSGRL